MGTSKNIYSVRKYTPVFTNNFLDTCICTSFLLLYINPLLLREFCNIHIPCIYPSACTGLKIPKTLAFGSTCPSYHPFGVLVYQIVCGLKLTSNAEMHHPCLWFACTVAQVE